MRGQLRSLPDKKNFGFIHYNGIEYFFHRDDFMGSWNELAGDFAQGKTIELSFEDSYSLRGPRARAVTRA